MTEEELRVWHSVIRANEHVSPNTSTPVPNDKLIALIEAALVPVEQASAMRFLALQTEAFAKCQTQRAALLDALKGLVDVARKARSHTSTDTDRLRQRVLNAETAIADATPEGK